MKCVLLTLVAAYKLQEGVTPIQKVIQLLGDMKAKGDTEAKDEAVAFSAFKQWCDDTSRQRQESIQEAEDLMEQAYDRKQGAQSLLQVAKLPLVPMSARKIVNA